MIDAILHEQLSIEATGEPCASNGHVSHEYHYSASQIHNQDSGSRPVLLGRSTVINCHRLLAKAGCSYLRLTVFLLKRKHLCDFRGKGQQHCGTRQVEAIGQALIQYSKAERQATQASHVHRHIPGLKDKPRKHYMFTAAYARIEICQEVKMSCDRQSCCSSSHLSNQKCQHVFWQV